jgi:hypothetical protein
MPLSYLRDDWHKQAVTHIRKSRRFKSMYTLQGKTRPTRHTFFTLSQGMVQDHTYLMHYMHLIWFSDFLQVLNSARNFYTKN